MADLTETRCLTTAELLRESWQFYQAAKQAEDMAGVARWGEALDFLLDRMNSEKRP